MKVSLLDVTPDAALKIGGYAGICYNAPNSHEANIKRAKKCKQDSHFATMRFAHAAFHISGMSRAVSEQMLRHKFLDFLKRSQRYCNDADNLVVVPPDIYKDKELYAIFMNSVKIAQEAYKTLVSCGIKKEDARFVLPMGVETEFVVVGSLQAWHDFLYGNAGRLQKAAQWEIKNVAIEIERILNEQIPELFEVTNGNAI